jgi:deoxyribonuclease (pyrimidine dimer)
VKKAWFKKLTQFQALMVRVNLVNPKCLTDQHLVAEYLEILMLLAYIYKYQRHDVNNLGTIPERFCLGKGHMSFFKNKVLYLKKRHELLKKEMRRRGFVARKTLSLQGIGKKLKNDWSPNPQDLQIIRKRLKQKISLKPEWYRYYRKKRSKKFLLKLIS